MKICCVIRIDWNLGIDFATQMTEGMKFLHHFNPQVLHRDMKSLNLLVFDIFLLTNWM